MRLTLRTLLAYLDDALDPQDAEALKQKLSESGFATQLVQRIRQVMVNGNLSAPSPDAVGPVEEGNVIGEYLDSTLPVEQVAEIERACLESDAHLAEAAACHQVLTIVLKKPAVIPQELRRRIYELPDRQIEDIVASGSFSGVAIPAASTSVQPLVSELPTSDATSVRPAKPIRPVGPDDSGVSDAPTRLRAAEAGLPVAEGRTATAGSRPRSVDQDTRIYGGSIRPSRIAPWLVSLGLAAVLLFVLAQLFQPLLNRKDDFKDDLVADTPLLVADASSDQLPPPAGAEATAETKTAAKIEASRNDVSPPSSPVQPDAPGAADAADADLASDAETVPTPDAESQASVETETGDVEAGESSSVAAVAPPAERADMTLPTSDDGVATGGQSAVDSDDRVAVLPASKSESETVGDVAADLETTADRSTPVPPPPQPMPPAEVDVVQDANKPQPMPSDEDRIKVASLLATDSLLAAFVGNQWIRLKQEATIMDGVKVFCAPTFRSPLSVTGGELTLIGPSQVEWVAQDDDRVRLWLEFGRLLITSTESDLVFPIQLGDDAINLRFTEPESVAAVEVSYFRAPGFDPLTPENRMPVTQVIPIKGKLVVEADQQREEIQVGQERRRRGAGEPEIAAVVQMPSWIDPAEAPLEATARSGLLELLDGTQAMKLQLREATMFRRSEVAALAARTLVGMGQSDVYFGGDGIFSEPKQRTNWPEHYAAVLAMIDRSAETAEQVHDSIVRMDSANSRSLLRLLNGYSQKQLAEGADAELVEMLDSPSMAVRVLALENLHRITGTTLYFHPDEENAVRRAPTIEKWEARLRKGDIRWQE